MDWYSTLQTWVDRFMVPLDDPGSRLFHWNIAVALLLVAGWSWLTYGKKWRFSILAHLVFRKKYWWNRSTKLDYQIYLINSLFKVFLLIPFLDISFGVATSVSQGLVLWHGDFAGLRASGWYLFLFTIGMFMFDDFLRFAQHAIMHKVPWLWRIHSVHHSAKILTPVTLYRNHPLESVIAALRNGLSLGIGTGIFIFLFGSRLSLWTLFGVNVFGFLFNLLGANLRHSHIPLGFGRWIEAIFISPRQHQIHHSSALEHRDRNFGVSLAIWDRLFGTLVTSDTLKKRERLRFGLGHRQTSSLKSEMWMKSASSRRS